MKTIETHLRGLLAVLGEDGAVIALGWPSGAQGGIEPLTPGEAKEMRAYLERLLAHGADDEKRGKEEG